ncbi:MAG TPA: DNA helicase RecG, partial [Candidatus Paceibacterota bacterium]|nr:DNA helicase RecG [Candidatus Paceibacterota bacterium]
FDLAEKDLALRGAGTMSGERQWGISDLGMEAIRNLKMVAAARAEAEKIIESNPDLSLHPNFVKRLGQRKQELHFE